MVLGEGEPAAGPWRVERLTQFDRFLVSAVGASVGRPPIVALDGRSSSGKTTLAHHLEQFIAGAVTVHTDDIAWWHSFFGWADLLASGVLEPIRRGQAVAFRPPAWDERGRPGAIELRVDASLVIVEGSEQAGARSRICLTLPCGCSRTSLRSSDEMPRGSLRARPIRRSSRGGCTRSSPLSPTSDHGSGHSSSSPGHQSCRTIRPPKSCLRPRLRAS